MEQEIKLMDRVRFIRLKEIEKDGKVIQYKEELHRGIVVRIGNKFIKIFNPEKGAYDDINDPESYPISCKRGWIEKM